MSKTRTVLLEIRKHCYISMCILLIFIGLFYLSCALLITVVPHYQQQIAKEFSTILSQPIDFSQIKFTWRGLRLYAKVYNVDIGKQNAEFHIDNIDKIQVLLHPVKSLVKLRPDVDNITVNGGKIYLNYDFAKLKTQKTTDNENKFKLTQYLEQIFNNPYLNWINIHKIDLTNTTIILGQGHQTDIAGSASLAKASSEYVLPHLNFYTKGKYNYFHGLVYQVNQAHLKSKDREILEFAIKYNKVNAKVHAPDNKFYLATNYKGLERVVNDFLSSSANKKNNITHIKLDSNTWLKAWGSIDDYDFNDFRFNKNFQFAIESPKILVKTRTNQKLTVKNINGIFDYMPLSSDNNYIIDIKSIELELASTRVNIKGNINKYSKDKPAVVNSYIHFGNTDITRFFKTLPAWVIGSDTSTWLRQHITRGRLGDSEIIWRGNLDASFPYDKNHEKTNGVFILNANLINTDIDYSPGEWPKIKGLTGNLTLRGRDITIESTSARLSNSNARHLLANINNIGKSDKLKLFIKADVATYGTDLHQVIDTTPLKHELGGVNKNISLDGEIDLALNLMVPLSYDADTDVSGSIYLKDNKLSVLDTPFIFNALHGSLDFTKATIQGENLTAKFNDRNAIFKIANNGKGKGTNIELHSWLDMAYLGQYYATKLNDYINGVTDFDLNLNLQNSTASKQIMKLHATSKLIGIESKLPEPYFKTKQQPKAVNFYIDHEFNEYTKYSLFVENIKPVYKNREPDLVLHRYNHKSSLLLNTIFAEGGLEFNDKNNDKVEGSFKYVKLSNNDVRAEESFKNIDYFNLPSLKLNIDALYLNNTMVGQLEFDISKNFMANDGDNINSKILKINNLNFDGDILKLNLHGQYTENNGSKTTAINGSYKLRELNKLAKIIADIDIKEKIRLNGEYQLTWSDELLKPNVNIVSGHVSIDSGFGKISDIEPGIGRVFSFFNLESLDKRLRLDFSDVFEEGYKFDYVKGKFYIDSGIVKTNKTSIEAGSADIELYGNINLNQKTYNLKADVTPHVTTGLPIAAAILGTPVAGAAVLLIDKILESPVNQLSEKAYSITGSWKKPVVKKIKHKRGPLIELSWFNAINRIESSYQEENPRG